LTKNRAFPAGLVKKPEQEHFNPQKSPVILEAAVRLKKLVVNIFAIIVIIRAASVKCNSAQAETLQGWHIAENSGNYAETDGVITLSGNEQSAGTTLYRDILPQTDFEISLQVKAETLGEVHADIQGAGEGLAIMLRPNASIFGKAIGINFELRARGGGQFLVLRHNSVADTNGWPYDWTPFIYNTLEYNDGSYFWQYSTPEVKANAPVKPDVWYTMKLKVQQTPFVITAEVLAENGTLLGTFPINDMNNFSFEDIHCLGVSSGFGGTFYVRNFTINGISPVEDAVISVSAEPSVTLGSPIHIQGNLTNGGVALANELILLKYTFAGAEEWYPITSTRTDAAGNYSAQWLYTATGMFTLRAEWEGNSTRPGAFANITLNSLPLSDKSVFSIESNSTVTSLAFNSTTSELSFTVSGVSNTTGYVKATIDKDLLANAQDLRVYLDGSQLQYSLKETNNAWLIEFNYSHSTHNLSIFLPTKTQSNSPLTGWPEQALLIALSSTPVAISIGLLVHFKKRLSEAQHA
jgi:hypothetical protein